MGGNNLTETGPMATAFVKVQSPSDSRATWWSDELVVVELATNGDAHALHVEGNFLEVTEALNAMLLAARAARRDGNGKASGNGVS